VLSRQNDIKFIRQLMARVNQGTDRDERDLMVEKDMVRAGRRQQRRCASNLVRVGGAQATAWADWTLASVAPSPCHEVAVSILDAAHSD
jgi:hypothetical protein